MGQVYLSKGKNWPCYVKNQELSMAKMNWNRAKKFSGYEEKYDHGTVKNGRRITHSRNAATVAADALLGKPVARSRLGGAKDWMSLQAFVAASGLVPKDLPGGADGIKQAASEIYLVPISGDMVDVIRAISKRKRRSLCRRYRKRHGLLSPKDKGLKRKREMESPRMQAIQEQLRPRD